MGAGEPALRVERWLGDRPADFDANELTARRQICQ
jgi:hypothetical protein